MSSFMLECEGCGQVTVRKGYAKIHHEDGSEEVRWDYLWIFSNLYGDAEIPSTSVEHPFSPEDARSLMWFLVFSYMPLLSPVYRRGSRMYDRWIYYPLICPILNWWEKRTPRA